MDVDGIVAKIERARHSLEDLRSEISSYCETKAAERRDEFSRGRRSWDFPQKGHGEPPVDWSVMVGEIAYNLRSSLDHLVWQLVIANGMTPSEDSQFPIYLCPRKYGKAAKGRLKGVSAVDCKRIRNLQPFVDQNDIGKYLWFLNRICNIDKHRHLNLMTDYSSTSAHIEGEVELGLLPEGIGGGLVLLAYLKGTEFESNVKMDIDYRVCFQESDLMPSSVEWINAHNTPIPYPPVLDSLCKCLSSVSSVVRGLTSSVSL